MAKRCFSLAVVALIILSAFVITQPKVWDNSVRLYLSDGSIQEGLLIEIRNLPKENRAVVIWSEGSYQIFQLRDVEVLAPVRYPRRMIERDLTRITWKKKLDCLVEIDQSSGKPVNYHWGQLFGYNNQNGFYNLSQRKFPAKGVGAVYFYNSNHASFAGGRNKFAQSPTINIVQAPHISVVPPAKRVPLHRRPGAVKRRILRRHAAAAQRQILPRPNRSPDVILYLDASVRLMKVTNCNRGDQFLISVEGNIHTGDGVAGPKGLTGGSRIRGDVGCGAVLAFSGPANSYTLQLPNWQNLFPISREGLYISSQYGALYLTVNDSILFNNKGSYKVTVWKVK